MSVLVGEMKRVRIEEFNESPPDDDRIWRRRTWGRGLWENRMDLPWTMIRDHLRRRGFRVRRDGEITHAPCSGCRMVHRVRELNYLRVCDTCGEGTPATICRQERQGREERADLRRAYTPTAWGITEAELGPWTSRRKAHG